MSVHAWVPIKLHLQRQVLGRSWHLGCSMLTPVLGIFTCCCAHGRYEPVPVGETGRGIIFPLSQICPTEGLPFILRLYCDVGVEVAFLLRSRVMLAFLFSEMSLLYEI